MRLSASVPSVQNHARLLFARAGYAHSRFALALAHAMRTLSNSYCHMGSSRSLSRLLDVLFGPSRIMSSCMESDLTEDWIGVVAESRSESHERVQPRKQAPTEGPPHAKHDTNTAAARSPHARFDLVVREQRTQGAEHLRHVYRHREQVHVP